MDLSLSNEKFAAMSSLLDKELDNLKHIGKPPLEIPPESTNRRPSTTTNPVFSDSNSKIQDDLSHLQNKLNFLEQKLTNFSGNTLKESKFSNFSQENSNRNPNFFNRKEYEAEINENTPLKQKYSDYELKDAVLGTKKADIERKNQKKLRKIEKSIEEKENSLNISKAMLRKSPSSAKKARSKPKSKTNSRQNSPNPVNQGILTAKNPNIPEVVQLNRKIMALKKSLEEERQALMKERQKNRDMTVEMEKISRKMKKLEVKNEKNSQLESDYVKLMESFEKSEAIRKQQKLLIANLKKESSGKTKKK